MNEQYKPSVRFEPNERTALLALLEYHLRNPAELELLLRPLQSAYGRILEGDDMTLAESRAKLPKGWYISQTGRRLKHRAETDVPLTHMKYEIATRQAILARGQAITAQAVIAA